MAQNPPYPGMPKIPPGFTWEQNPDGTWSAWDPGHTGMAAGYTPSGAELGSTSGGGSSPVAEGSSGYGSMGDVVSTVMNSPWYQQMLSASRAADASDLASLKEALRQGFISWGEDIPGFSDRYGAIDQTTRDLALKNTQSGLSATARLRMALADANKGTNRGLTARGMRRSGARGFQLRRNQLSADQNRSDALARLL